MYFRNIVLLLFAATAFANEVANIPQVDFVVNSLSRQQWDDDEAKCRDKIFNVLHNVKNSTLWASWIWNSIPQAPVGIFFGARFHLGNYDQCLRPPWLFKNPELRTQYCLADIEMSKDPAIKNWDLPGPYEKAEEYYVNARTVVGRSFSFMSYGVCLPSGCQTKSVKKFVKALLSAQHLQAAWDAEVKIHHCEEAGAPPNVPPIGYYAYRYTFAVLAIMAVASTYYMSEYSETAKANTFVNHVAKSFCLRHNWATVFKDDKDALNCMNGIKFLSAIIVVITHVGMYSATSSNSNGLDVEKALESAGRSIMIVHVDLIVDVFFAMSALLLGKSLSTMNVTKPYNLLKMIIKRYIRLVGMLAVVVLYIAYMMMQQSYAPLYPKMLKREQQACQRNWWITLLMLGNYVNTHDLCHVPTWYIPCDFHFYVITLVLLYVYRKNPKIGKISTAVVLFLGFLAPGISTYVYDLPSVWTFDIGLDSDVRKHQNFTKGYIPTHNRMSSYVAGLAVGYVMSLYKPADYKKIWSKTTSFLAVSAGFMIMAVVALISVTFYINRVHGLLACLYMMLDRITFATGILLIIIFCTYGDVPLLNSFLGWTVFRPLSRLSYGVYLIHSILIYTTKMGIRNHTWFDKTNQTVEALGLVVVCLVFSMIGWLLVEAPLINFTNRYLDTRSESKRESSEVANGTGPTGVPLANDADKQKVM